MIVMMPKRKMMMMLVIEGLGLLAALSDGLGGEDIETGLVASKTKTKAETSVRMKTLLKTIKKIAPPSCPSKLSYTSREERNVAQRCTLLPYYNMFWDFWSVFSGV